MRIKLILGSLALFIGLISCHKDDDIIKENPNDTPQNEFLVYDTVKPLDYFPVYPGSFWKYRIVEKQYEISINDNDTNYTLTSQDTSFIELTTASEYMIHNYVRKSYYDYDSAMQIKEYSDTVYVPFLNGQPIYGYYKIDFASIPPFGDTTYKKYPFLSEIIGFEFLSGWYDDRFEYIRPYYKIIAKTTDLNNDSMIVVYGHYKAGPYYNLSRDEWKYYYKDIGLKLNYLYDRSIEDTIYKKDLIEYYINK